MRVSPGMFETKVIVAPNSPIERAKPSTSAGQHAGQAQRQRDRREACATARRPSVRAAPSSRRSTASIDRRIARTISGSAITAAASAAPVQRNIKRDAEPLGQPAPGRAVGAEREQQQPAGHHRRQHQRQVDERVEQQLARESARAPAARPARRRSAASPRSRRRLTFSDSADDLPFVGRQRIDQRGGEAVAGEDRLARAADQEAAEALGIGAGRRLAAGRSDR